MKQKGNVFFRIEMLILSFLSQKDLYGYELAKAVTEGTNHIIVLKEGTMYPILYKLLDQGYISSFDKIVKKKIRVYYHLEPEGKEYLTELKEVYFSAIKQIELALEGGATNGKE